MKLCKKCNCSIPNRAIIDGKSRVLKSRKFCLTCSPFGNHNTRNICKPTDDDGIPLEKVCAKCNITKPNSEFYRRKDRIGILSYCKGCTSLQCKERTDKIKNDSVNYKGGKCVVCGYSRCHAALDFHHLDPSKKEFGIGGKRCKTFLHIKEELDKCVLLCANCHREVENGFITIPENV